MSAKNYAVGGQETRHDRRIDPPVIQLRENDLRDVALGPLEGSITLLWAREDTAILEAFDEALATGDRAIVSEIQNRVAEEADFSDEAPSSNGARAIADLLFHGREVASDLALTDADPFGVALVPYEGGDLDASEFEIRERSSSPGADYEYRVIVAPPTLDDAEADAMEYGPSDTDGAVLVTEPARASAVAFAFAAGVVVGVALTGSGSADPGLRKLDWELPDGSETGASVDELVEARRKALG